MVISVASGVCCTGNLCRPKTVCVLPSLRLSFACRLIFLGWRDIVKCCSLF